MLSDPQTPTSLSDPLLSTREVEQMLGISRSTLSRLRKTPGFPAPVYVTSRTVRFQYHAIKSFIESRIGERS